MGFQRERLAVLIVGVAITFGVYGIVVGVLEGSWVAVQVSMALLAMTWFHYVERRRNFLVGRGPSLELVDSLKRFLRRHVDTPTLRHLGVELLVVGTILYVVATFLYFLGANIPTIIAGIGIGLVLIAFRKYHKPRRKTLVNSRL